MNAQRNLVPDEALLEDLLQHAVEGDALSAEFAQLADEIQIRLIDAYGEGRIPPIVQHGR